MVYHKGKFRSLVPFHIYINKLVLKRCRKGVGRDAVLPYKCVGKILFSHGQQAAKQEEEFPGAEDMYVPEKFQDLSKKSIIHLLPERSR